MISRSQIFLISFAFSAAVVLPWGIIQPRALDDVRNLAFDAFQRQSPRKYNPEIPVRVVGIDEDSLNSYGQWPWSRQKLAELTQILTKLGASAIVYDVIFAEQDRSSLKAYVKSLKDSTLRRKFQDLLSSIEDSDNAFASAIAQGPIVLGAVATDKRGASSVEKAGFVTIGDDPSHFLVNYNSVIAPLNELVSSARGLGTTNWLPDHDQVVRSVPLIFRAGNEYVPSLALEALRVAQGADTFIIRSSNANNHTAFGKLTGINTIKVGSAEIATGSSADVRPRYSYTNVVRDISAKNVLQGHVSRSEIEGRIIFIGALAVGLGDIRATPLEPAVAGVDIHAQITEALLSDALLSRPDWASGLEFIIALVAFLSTMVLLFLAPPFIAAAFGPFAVLCFLGGAFLLFQDFGLLIDPIYPSAVVIGGYLVGAVTLWRAEIVARGQVIRAFGKYLAPAVVDQIALNPNRLVLGGEAREISILLCDLRNFSSISEELGAADLTRFMNRYFAPLTDAIIAHEGTVDKYIGDAILAFWNAPLDIKNHELQAARSALAMREAVTQLNKERIINKKVHISFGIGLHSGTCVVGNMGSDLRFDYSILGDPVNVTSRLESASKMFSIDILATDRISKATPQLAWLDLDLIRIIGRNDSAHIFALVGDEKTARSSFYRDWHNKHECMMNLYRSCEFLEAASSALEIYGQVETSWQPLYIEFSNRFSFLSEHSCSEASGPLWVPLVK